MNSQMLSGRKIELALLISAAVGLVFSLVPMLSGEKLKNASLLTEGVGTCFTRVQQSYTAKIVGDSSSEYLRTSFFTDTEDCFGEVLGISKSTNIFAGYKAGLVSLNGLVSEVHWFHESLKGGVGFNSGDDTRKVAEKYGKLESARFSVEGALGSLRASAVTNFTYFKIFTITSIVAFAGLATIIVMKRRRVQEEFEQIENRARKILEEGRFSDLREVGQLIESYCARLDLGYGQRVMKGLIDIGEGRAIELKPAEPEARIESKHASTLISFQVNESPMDDKAIDKIWEESVVTDADQIRSNLNFVPESQLLTDSTDNDTDNTIKDNLVDGILARVIDQLTPRFFKDGLMVELDSDDKLTTDQNPDLIEQIFLEMFSLALHREAGQGNGASSLSIRSYRENEKNFFLLVGPGIGLENLSNLKIINQLVKEIGGQFHFRPLTSSNGTEIGCQLQLVYETNNAIIENKTQDIRGVETDKRRLTSVKKGKKKDLAQILN
jgi:hypothetical protein